MQDVSLESGGAEIFAASSIDDRYPPESILRSDASVWVTTGLYPQEVIIALPSLVQLVRIKTQTINVRKIVIERCAASEPTVFEPVIEVDYSDRGGRVQHEMHQVKAPTRFLKVQIASGYDDFAAVQRIECLVDPTAPAPAAAAAPAPSVPE